MKWERVELGEVCLDFQNGIGKSKEFYGKGVKVANIGDLYNAPFFKPLKTSLLDVSKKEQNKYALRKGDVLFVRSSVKREGVGYCSMYDSDELCLFSSFMIRATPNEKLVLPKYLAYILRAPQARQMIINAANTATITNISQSNLKSLQIPLPPLPEQRRLAARLDKADALRQKSRAVVETYAELGRSVFLEVFGDPVRNERGWEVVELASLIPKNEKIAYGIVQPGKEDPTGIPIIRVKDFHNMAIDASNLKRVSPKVDEKHKKTRLIGNEILIACVGSIGKVAVVDKSLQNANIVRATARIPANKNRIDRTFLAYYLSSKFVQDYFIKTTRTVSQPTLNIKQIKETPILLPPLPLQARFAAMVANIESQRRLAERQLLAAEAVFGGVLQGTFEM